VRVAQRDIIKYNNAKDKRIAGPYYIQDVPFGGGRFLTTLWILSPRERCDWPVMRHNHGMF
jgi:hypothetical protein